GAVGAVGLEAHVAWAAVLVVGAVGGPAAARPLVAEALPQAGADEALVAGQLVGRQDLLHSPPPKSPSSGNSTSSIGGPHETPPPRDRFSRRRAAASCYPPKPPADWGAARNAAASRPIQPS